MSGELTHFDSSGASRMVSVGKKEITERMARAQADVRLQVEQRQEFRGDSPGGGL